MAFQHLPARVATTCLVLSSNLRYSLRSVVRTAHREHVRISDTATVGLAAASLLLATALASD